MFLLRYNFPAVKYKVCRLLSFNRCIHLCSPRHPSIYWTFKLSYVRDWTSLPRQSSTPSHGRQPMITFTLVYPVLELHINKIIYGFFHSLQHVFLLRLSHIVACISVCPLSWVSSISLSIPQFVDKWIISRF